MNSRPLLTPDLARLPSFGDFTLLDVGASRGIDEVWTAFGDSLIAYGFEPLVAEVERLNARAKGERVRYFDAFIVRNSSEKDQHAYRLVDLIPRSSAAAAMQLTGNAYVEERFAHGAKAKMTSNRYSIDEFALHNDVSRVDFIKTDTDGNDYSVLLGAEKTLQTRGVLGLAVEVFFTLPAHPEANLFANVDHYLRSLGFTLFDINVRRYTKDAFPGKFRYDIPAETLRGQVVWADVLYMRDLASGQQDSSPTIDDVLKTMCLFEIFNLPDCALELTNVFGDLIKAQIDPEQIRGLILKEATISGDYGSYIRAFEASARERRYAPFPDGFVVKAEGYLLQNTLNPAEHIFRER
jgi:FkbM family methyltransferase